MKFCFALFLFTSVLFAQFAAITGRVTDPSGGALPSVKVSARNEGTGGLSETVTNQEGYFVLPNLPIGSYTIEAAKEGFGLEKKSDLRLQVGQNARSDFQLKLGTVVSTIDVQGLAPFIQSESSSVGAVVESRQILGVPLNGRSLFNVLSLAPGVQNAGTSPRIGGGPGNSNNNFTIDGTSNNDTISARGEGAYPSLDMVAEFEVVNVNAPAEFGRGGAQIRVVTNRAPTISTGVCSPTTETRNLPQGISFHPPYRRITVTSSEARSVAPC